MNHQSQKTKTILGLALVCMTALLIWRWMFPPEPTYDGRTVREWLEELVVLDGRTQDEEAVRTAIQAMGTNAIPGLLKWMAMPFEAPPLRYRIKLICIRYKLLYRLAPRRAYNPKDEEHWWSVGTAAEALRPRAKEIVPVLVRSYHSDMRCQRDVLRLLGYLESAEAVPFLSSEVTNTDMYLRSSVYWALGTIKHEGSIPVLVEGLKDPELWVCRSVASALGNFGPSASNAVPALEALLSRQERVTASNSQSELRLEAIDAAKGALQDISGGAQRMWTSRQITHMDLNHVLACSQAYRYVAIERMLGEANLFAGRSGLPERLPIRKQDLAMAYVSAPFLLGGTGALDTEKYSFGFGSNGRLRYVTHLNPFGSQRFIEIQEELAKIASNLTTNEAYQLATNWIAALSIDVNALEKTHPVCMRHQFYYGDNNRQIELPIIDVLWGDQKKPAVEVSIYGPDRKLLKLRQNDESFSRKPTGMAKDPAGLLNINDTDFSQFSNEQRSNLVSEFVISPGK